MDLVLQRTDATQHSTPGELTGIAGFTFQTLEPPPVPDSDYDNCPVCIPAGRYEVTMAYSDNFSKMLGYTVYVPLLHDIPPKPPYHPLPYTGVEVHFGNTVEAPGSTTLHPVFLSEACILVGDTRLSADEILGTRDACISHVWPTIAAALAGEGQVWLDVRDPA